ncbi:MAG: malonyl-CoA decarboxylase [Burkholderiaceae bacterium]|nr:malonyl-CoA decarboxylase [Burkholderiaceae bacterium]
MFERLLQVGRDVRERSDLRGLLDDCRQLLTARGESNSLVIAARALERYRRLSPDAAARFFDALASEFDPDAAEVLRRAESYAMTRAPDALIELWRAAESPRQELLRRLNRAPDATAQIVAMRAKILARLSTHPELRAVEADFHHLLSSWFNPGFLNLVQVDWNSPARLLEKLIQHEAVHRIDGWNDLRRRLEPDRRCFAFFHPALPDEPLIFVEVALLESMPDAIAPLLDRRTPTDGHNDRFKVAAFYSISNCQPGLRGVSLGDFLIKRVAERLQAEQPKLKVFCTLSPIPGFAGWLSKLESVQSVEAPRVRASVLRELDDALRGLRDRHGHDLLALAQKQPAPARAATALAGSAAAGAADAPAGGSAQTADEPVGASAKTDVAPGAPAAHALAAAQGAAGNAVIALKNAVAKRRGEAPADASTDDAARNGRAADLHTLQRLCALYLLQTSPTDARASDPVARFHLNNGARLERIDVGADLSRKGLRQSLGLMVNYLYDLEQIEANHERFAGDRVSASRAVLSLL